MRAITKIKKEKRERRHKRIRSRVKGTESRPRISIFKSNRYLYVQIVNDETGRTLVSASTNNVGGKGRGVGSKELGKLIAEKALAKKIKKVVFDRGGYIYTGKVKLLAEGAREGGLVF